jgi:predicted enzyme related to lactoylglutathione lyase
MWRSTTTARAMATQPPASQGTAWFELMAQDYSAALGFCRSFGQFYIAVADVDAAVATVARPGGTLFREPEEILMRVAT